MYRIGKMPYSIDIGFTGETGFRKIEIDMTEWMADTPDGVPSIVAIRPMETEDDAYIAATTFEDNILTWVITAGDLGSAEGDGIMQVWLEEEENDSIVKRGKSVKVITKVQHAVNSASEDPPAAQAAVLEQMTALKTATVNAAAAAEEAVEHYPYVDETTGNWFVWDADGEEFVDTEVHAQGPQGETGQTGPSGSDGSDGADGVTFTPSVSAEGVISWTNDGGKENPTSRNITGPAGQDGADGADGADGYTPVKGTDYWTAEDKAEIVADAAADVVDEIIDDNAGDGDTNKTWSADKLYDLNSAISAKYTKPDDGIPSTDLASGVQTSLGKADTAYQKPQTGIPATDIADGVIPVVTGFASKVSSATSGHFAGLDSNGNLTDSGKSASDFGTYSKPSGGIPETDLSSSLTGFIGDTSTNLGSTTETTITDLTNMTVASATEGNVQLTITKTHITAYGVCNATRIRTLQDNIVCSAGNYEFSVGTIIPTAGYQIQVFNVTDNEVLVSAAASATSPVITFTLATQKTLRLRALVTSGKSIDSSNEVYLHKVVSASTPNTLASVAKGIVDGHMHGKNILAFGDSIWGDDRTNGISDFLAEYSGATIYNAGIGGTRITGDRTTSEGEKFIPFDGVTLINALISGTWTDQDAQINNIWAYVKNDTLPMLKALDLQTIDIVILAYGTNDFTANKSISDVSTAFLSAVSALLTANPKLRIICILPPWRMFSSNTVDGDTYENSNNDTLQEFNEGIISAIKPKHTETMNMFEQLPWRAETKSHYMDSDAVHPNRNGNMVYAHVVNGKLKTMY